MNKHAYATVGGDHRENKRVSLKKPVYQVLLHYLQQFGQSFTIKIALACDFVLYAALKGFISCNRDNCVQVV